MAEIPYANDQGSMGPCVTGIINVNLTLIYSLL